MPAGALIRLRGALRGAGIRRPAIPPITRAARLIASGRQHGSDYLKICLDLGLRRRAMATYKSLPAGQRSPILDLRVALAGSSLDEAVAVLDDLIHAAGRDQTQVDSMLSEVIDIAASIAPDRALALIRRHLPQHPARAALSLSQGDLDDFQRTLRSLGSKLGPDRWLLLANALGPNEPIAALNNFLTESGLRSIAIRDDRPSLGVASLCRDEAFAAESAMAPRLSVVMTVYNAERYVRSAIQSVLQQDHQNFELVVVDDCSTDTTWDVVRAIREKDSRIVAVQMPRNQGTYAAKNVGLSMVTGDFVGFQDADDWSHPQRFRQCLRALQRNPRLVAVSCNYIRLSDDGKFHSARAWPMSRWTPNSILFRRDIVLQRIGFFDEHRFGADSEYVARVRECFGLDALSKVRLPMIVAAHRPDSLMTADSTGIDATGRSDVRADYQEHWTESLIDKLVRGEALFRPAMTTIRSLG